MAPNFDTAQIMKLYGTNGFNTQGAINLAGSAVGGQSYSEIAWFSGAIQNMSNGTTEQKVQTGMNVATKVMSWLVGGMGVKEGAQSSIEVAKHTADAKKVGEEQKKAEQELQGKIDKVNTEIENHLETIEHELDVLADYGQVLTKKQEKTQEIKKEIDKKKEALQAAATPEEKNTILGEIGKLSEQLGAIAQEMTQLSEELAKSQETVDEHQEGIEKSTEEAEQVTTQGQEDVQRIEAQGNQSLADAASDSQMSTDDKKAATELQIKQAEVTTFSFGFGAGKAAAMQADIAGYNTGSGNRSNGANAVNQFAQFGLGALNNNNLSMLNNFANSLGQYTTTSANFLGDYQNLQSQLMSSITSFGSLKENSEELNQSVEADIQTIQNQEDSENAELQTSQVEIEEVEVEVEA